MRGEKPSAEVSRLGLHPPSEMLVFLRSVWNFFHMLAALRKYSFRRAVIFS